MRQLEPEVEYHKFRAVQAYSELLLIGSGSDACLWAGPVGVMGTMTIHTFSGPASLRALARAILKFVPAPKPKRKKGRSK